MNKSDSNSQSIKYNFTTFTELLFSISEKTPYKTAFVQLNEAGEEINKINYLKLVSNSIYISSLLLKKHRKGDRCLIVIPPGIEFITAFLGCFFAGIIAVPTMIPKRNKTNNRFWPILQDSEAHCILTTKEINAWLGNQQKLSTKITDNKSRIIFNIPDYEDFICELPTIYHTDTAFLQYTSGSTTKPKGIKVSHRNLLHNSEVVKRSFNHTNDLVVVSWLPPFHDMGLIGCMLQPLYVGGSCVIIQPTDFFKNPAIWFEAVSKYKGTTIGCPNFALDYCVEKIKEPDINTMELSSLKVLFCGSEPVRKNTLQNFSYAFSVLNFKPEMFLPCYGLAEATLMLSGISQQESPQYFNADLFSIEKKNIVIKAENNYKSICFTSCGKCWANTEVIIVDPTNNFELSDNQIGEIWVKNDSVCDGYWNKSESTNAVFKGYTSDKGKGPFLKTGDLGFINNNQLFITGRKKDLIIIRGLNIYPNDIENIVDKCHPALQANSCAVFSIEKNNQEKLIIVQEIKRVHIRDHNKDEIFTSIIKAVLDNFEISVHSIALISPMSLSKTSSGKIKRLECKNLYLNNNLKILSSWKESEKDIADITHKDDTVCTDTIISWIKYWLSSKLNINPLEIDSNQPILSLGLDSIGAVELEKDINEKFETDLFIGDFLENNSINYLAEVGLKNMKLAI